MLVSSVLKTDGSLLDCCQYCVGLGKLFLPHFPKINVWPCAHMKGEIVGWKHIGVKMRLLKCVIHEQSLWRVGSVFFQVNVDSNHRCVIHCRGLPLWIVCTP